MYQCIITVIRAVLITACNQYLLFFSDITLIHSSGSIIHYFH